MAYEDSLIREKVSQRATDAANAVQRDLPETERERLARMTPQVIDASDSPPIGMRRISTLTT